MTAPVDGVSQTGAPVFGSPFALNADAAPDTRSDFRPHIATDGAGTWVAVWEAVDSLECHQNWTNRTIYAARSTDGGQGWSTPVVLSNPGANDSHAHVATDGAGTWLVVWQSRDPLDGTIGYDPDIFVARSTDNGGTWSAPSPLNTDAAADSPTSGWDEIPQVAADGMGLWLAVWTVGGKLGGDSDIVVAHSSDDGITWSAPRPLNRGAASDDGYDSISPGGLSFDGYGTWVAVWSSNALRPLLGSDWDVLAARSSDGGLTWSEPVPVNSYATGDSALDLDVQVATDGTTWLAVWESTIGGSLGSDSDIVAAYSADQGRTWSVHVPVNSYAADDCCPLQCQLCADTRPRVATDGMGNWVVSWEMLSAAPNRPIDFYWAHSTDLDGPWSTAQVLNRNPTPLCANASTPAQLATDGTGNWIAVWGTVDSLGGEIGNDYDILASIGRSPMACDDQRNPCPDPGEFCTAIVCDDATGRCVTIDVSEQRCPNDRFCTRVECDEGSDTCIEIDISGERCSDDAFCTDTFCDEDLDACTSVDVSDVVCPNDEQCVLVECDEVTDSCSRTDLSEVWLADFDDDGFTSGVTITGCAPPAGYKRAAEVAPGDCDDSDASLTPADHDQDGMSTCDGDCDDTDPAMPDTWYADEDGDGFTSGLTLLACNPPPGYRRLAEVQPADCNDLDATLTPADVDGDGLSPCDGDCDDTDPAMQDCWVDDYDGDGFSGAMTYCGCNPPPWFKRPAEVAPGDCDDHDATLTPADVDGDGFSTCDYDCNDGDPELTPADADRDGLSSCDGDCDDTDPLVTIDRDGDGVCFPPDNCPAIANPLQADVDWDGDGDLCDPCPGNYYNDCEPDGSGAAEVSTFGGTVEAYDGSATLDVDLGDLLEERTLSITKATVVDWAVDIQLRVEFGEVIASYNLEPSGSFSESITLTILADVTGLTPDQRAQLDIYRKYQPAGQEMDSFTPLFADCTVEQRGDAFIAACSVELDHFSILALIAPAKSVVLDIRPGECPNPWNAEIGGVLTVGLAGTTDLDVRLVDVDTVRLCLPGEDPIDESAACIAARKKLRGLPSTLEDITSPVELWEPCDCVPAAADGIEDLGLKFRSDDLADMLVGLPAGATQELVLHGKLLPQPPALSGVPFVGRDCVLLVPP